MGDWARAKIIAEPIMELAAALNYRKRMAQTLMVLSVYEDRIRGDSQKAIEYSTKALEISTEINHRPSIQMANYWLTCALLYNCEFERTVAHCRKALEINIEVNSLWGIAAAKSSLAACLNYRGKTDLGYKISREALDLAEEHQDTYSESFACTYYGYACFQKGFLEEAVAYLLRGLEVSDRIKGARQMFDCRQYAAEAYLALGHYDKCIHFASGAISVGERFQYAPDELNCIRLLIEIAKAQMGERDLDLVSLFRYEKEKKRKTCEGRTRMNIGWVLLSLGETHLGEAEEWFRGAIDADERNGMRWNLATDYLLLAECCQQEADRPRARENLNKAISIFQECGADGWVRRTKEKVAQL
jgi:tetratricopeptide (TPR) repeat protein